MALTVADIQLLASKDGIWKAPKDAPDYSDDPNDPNHYWSLGTHIVGLTTKIRGVEGRLADVDRKIDALSVGGVDLDALAAKVAPLLAAELAARLAE